MPTLIDKLFLTSIFATVAIGIVTLILFMVSDASEDKTLETLFTIFFTLLLLSPIVALILAIVKIWI